MNLFMGILLSKLTIESAKSVVCNMSIAEQIRYVNNFILNYFNNVLYKLNFLW